MHRTCLNDLTTALGLVINHFYFVLQQLLHVFMFVRIVISQETDLYHNIGPY